MGLCVAAVPGGGRSRRSPSDHKAPHLLSQLHGKVPDDIAPCAAALLIFTLSSISTSHSFAPGEDRQCHMQGGRGEVGEGRARDSTLGLSPPIPSLPPCSAPSDIWKDEKGLSPPEEGTGGGWFCVSRAQKQPLQGAAAPTATQSEPALLKASPSLRDVLRQSKEDRLR